MIECGKLPATWALFAALGPVHPRTIKPFLLSRRHSCEKRYQALSRFSVPIIVMESWEARFISYFSWILLKSAYEITSAPLCNIQPNCLLTYQIIYTTLHIYIQCMYWCCVRSKPYQLGYTWSWTCQNGERCCDPVGGTSRRCFWWQYMM